MVDFFFRQRYIDATKEDAVSKRNKCAIVCTVVFSVTSAEYDFLWKVILIVLQNTPLLVTLV